MRSKPALSSVVLFLLLGPCFTATLAQSAPPRPLAVTNTTPLVEITLLAATNSAEEAKSDVPIMCSSTNKLASYCRRKGIPVEIRQIQVQTNSLLFVLACPYSGINNTDLYCYARAGKRWILFLSTGVSTAPPAIVSFVPEGDFVSVLRLVPEGDFVNVLLNRKVILKISPPN